MRFDRIDGLILKVSIAWVWAGAAVAGEGAAPGQRPVVYNVRDYGAKGDGQADDTAAVVKAIEAAGKDPATTSQQSIPGTPYYGIQPEILFPAGTYRVSAPVRIGHYVRVRGEGNAALAAASTDQDFFVVHPQGATWRNQFSGLLFLGGRRAIVLSTRNLDTGHILIRRCQFYGQAGCAVFCEDGCNSTLLKLSDCEFLGCEQVLRNTCDMAVLADCWISTRPEMKDKAVLENRGYLIAERVIGVPQPVAGNDQRWIDNYGLVTCRSFRFGGEGAGFTAVVNFAPYSRKYPVWPTSVVLEDCPIYCLGNAKRKGAIYCHEVPNMITVRNCTGLVDAPLVMLDPSINPDAYFADARANPSLCRYLLRDNTVNETWGSGGLPAVMRQFSSQPLGTVNVREFHVTGNGGGDDAAGLQAAMDYAAAARLPVVIPSGDYRIGKTVRVTAIEVRGEGRPRIYAREKDFDLFYADAWRVTIDGLRFQGGRDQVSIGNGNIDQSMFTVRNCEFAGADGAAVRFREHSNSTSAHVERCGFGECRQALVTWCDGTMLRDCWITASSEMKNMAVIENRSGYLSCEKILGVPLVNGSDQRWIDNYASVACRDFRFGGEGAGYTAVVNFVKRATSLGGPKVVLDGCWVSALGNNQRACAVYCEEIPNQIAITNCELAGVPAVLVDKRIDLEKYFLGVRPGMLRYDVSGNTGEFAGQLPEAMMRAATRRSGKTDYGREELTEEETAKALASAMEAAGKLPVAPAGRVESDPAKGVKGHRQQTDPAKYLDLVPPRASWDVQAAMDGTSEPNAERLAVGHAGSRTVIVRRIGADSEFGGWPHVLVKNIEIDLDRTPWLSWRIADAGFKACGYAVKVIDRSTGKMVTLGETHWAPFFDYRAYDLRKALGHSGGKIKVDVKFYYLGLCFPSATECLKAKKGEYLVVDFLRTEGE